MKVEEAIKRRRTIRKFKDKEVSFKTLKKLADAGRLAPSGMNLQPLEFLIVDDQELGKKIFRNSGWAGSVEWSPSEEERPRAYIVILANREVRSEGYEHDSGLAAENICLSAVSEGLGTCILGSIDKKALRSFLNVPSSREIDIAIGIGYPDHESKIEEFEGSKDYWRDENSDFHVPKKSLKSLIHRNKF